MVELAFAQAGRVEFDSHHAHIYFTPEPGKIMTHAPIAQLDRAPAF